MKKKNTLVAAMMSLLLAGTASAATISVGRGGSTNGYAVFNGDTNLSLTGGFYIAVGTYSSAPVITTTASLISAVADFNVFASVLSPTSGTTIGSVTGSFLATNAAFNSAPLYFLIGNGTTRENSTAFAILSGDPTPFAFPATAGQASGSGTVTLSGAAVASPLANAGTELDIASAPDRLNLVAIPEPSTALLGLLGLAGLIRRRR